VAASQPDKEIVHAEAAWLALAPGSATVFLVIVEK